MKQPKISLALTQHQINWWDNFNIKLFEKILKQKIESNATNTKQPTTEPLSFIRRA